MIINRKLPFNLTGPEILSPQTPNPLVPVFDADAEKFTHTTPLPDRTAFTICCWFRKDAIGNSWNNVFAFEGGGGTHVIQFNSNTTSLILFDVTFPTIKVITTGVWAFAAMTMNGSTLTGYAKMFGELNLSSASVTQSNFAYTTLTIGNSVANDEINGPIGAIKAWDATLTRDELEIESRYYTPVRLDKLHGWWPAASPGTVTKDFSGNQRDLTQGGTPTYVAGPPITWSPSPARKMYFFPTATTAQTLTPGAPTITFSAPALIVSAGNTNITMGAPVVTFTSPAVTVSAAVSLALAAPAITFSAPALTTVTAVTQTLGTPTVVFSAPAAAIAPGGVTLAASTVIITFTAPAASIFIGQTLEAGAPVVTFSAPATTVVTGGTSVLAGTPTVVFSAPAATAFGEVSLVAATAPVITYSAPSTTFSTTTNMTQAGAPTIVFSAPFANLFGEGGGEIETVLRSRLHISDGYLLGL